MTATQYRPEYDPSLRHRRRGQYQGIKTHKTVDDALKMWKNWSTRRQDAEGLTGRRGHFTSSFPRLFLAAAKRPG
jgi:hypothetical protein